MNVFLTISSVIFPLITFPYASRVLLPEGMGKVSFAVSFVTYFSMLSQLGIPTYGIRACAKLRENRQELSKVVQELFIINIILMIVAYIILGIVVSITPKLSTEKELYIIMSCMILLNAIGMEWLYKALEQYVYITLRSLVFKVISLFSLFIFVREPNDYIIYGAITVLASSGSMILNFLNIHKLVSCRPIKQLNFKKHLKPIFVFFAIAFSAALYTNMDTVLLGFLKSDIEVGYYNAAIRIKGVLVGITTSLGAVVLPRVSYYIDQKMNAEFEYIVCKSANFIYVISIPIMTYFFIFAVPIIMFLAGENYLKSVLPLQIMMLSLPIIGITNLLGIQILTPKGKEIYILYANIIGAIADIIININIIPQLGASGAALASLIAEVCVFIFELWLLKDECRLLFRKFQYFKMFFALMFGILASSLISNLQQNIFMYLIFSGISFFGITYITLFILKEPLIKEIIQKLLNKFSISR